MTPGSCYTGLFHYIGEQPEFFNLMKETKSIVVFPELRDRFASSAGLPRESITIITPTKPSPLFGDRLGPREGYEQSANRFGAGLVFRNHDRQTTIFQEFVDEKKMPIQEYLVQRSTTTDQLCFPTSEFAVCLFPSLTLMRKYAFLQGKLLRTVIEAAQTDGYSLADEEDYLAAEMTELRSFGDSHCQVLKLKMPGSLAGKVEQIDWETVFSKEWTFQLEKPSSFTKIKDNRLW